MREPRVTLMELREYRSQAGSTYFAGYLGKARVIVLRDDRAEITGKEVARWSVLLEEQPPREDRPSTAARPSVERRTSRPRREPTAGSAQDERERSAQDRRAGALLRERGIDPASPPPNDAIPF